MTTEMLSIGKSIVSAQDTLSLNGIASIYQQITGVVPSGLAHDTLRLRKLMTLDKMGYKAAKTRLPYVVGSIFDGGVRRIDSFISAHYFILDFDEVQIEDGKIPTAILSDSSVLLAFISPSGCGVKIFFRLKTPCTNAKQYAATYKRFAAAFADGVGLPGSIDLRTSDVSRACFLAHDPNAFYNPLANLVDWEMLVDNSMDPNLEEAEGDSIQKSTEKGLDPEAYKDLLKSINPNAPVRREKSVYLPLELIFLKDEIASVCEKVNLKVTKIDPINYGLKVVAGQGYRSAEVNIFYGKKGYSVVISPRTGTDPVLNNLLFQCIYQHLFPPCVPVDISLTGYFSLN